MFHTGLICAGERKFQVKQKPQEKAETNFYEYPLHNEFLNSTSGHKFRTTVRRCCKILWVPGCIFSIIHLGLRNL